MVASTGTELPAELSRSQRSGCRRRAFRGRVAVGGTGDLGAGSVGPYCGAGSWELDCRRRIVHVGLGGRATR
jgi:hypothetical protein